MNSFATIAVYAVIGALIAWRVYARFQRMVGRQQFSQNRATITLVIFPLLVVLLALPSFAHPLNLLWPALALSCGVALGLFGLSRTRFEAVAGEGLFYTPNAHLGMVLSLLFVARIVYRLVETFVIAPELPRSPEEFSQNPLTLAVFYLLAGYYITYAIGLVRWHSRVLRIKQAREEEQVP